MTAVEVAFIETLPGDGALGATVNPSCENPRLLRGARLWAGPRVVQRKKRKRYEILVPTFRALFDPVTTTVVSWWMVVLSGAHDWLVLNGRSTARVAKASIIPMHCPC